MKVYFDTEFTTLNSLECPALLSIGCVASNGAEFYREFSTGWTRGQCSQFVIDTVLPLMQGGEFLMSEARIAKEMKSWIESFGEEVVFVSDAPSYDWPLLVEMFSYNSVDWPANAKDKCESIKFSGGNDVVRYQAVLADYFRTDPRQHHALVDARAMRFALKFMGRRKRN